ncbi:MAG: CvpA family protein [bacterium]
MFEAYGFNIADVAAMVFIAIGLIIGFRQGLSGQMTILLTALAIGMAFVKGFAPCRDWLINSMAFSRETADVWARVLLIALPLLAGILIFLLLRCLLKITFTTWVDRIGGALAGGTTAAGIVLLVFILLNSIPAEKQFAVFGNSCWISREVIGGETHVIREIRSRVEKGESLIEKARREHAGKREKWEQ